MGCCRNLQIINVSELCVKLLEEESVQNVQNKNSIKFT